ncbi:hypothetical protein BC829DRAFT_115318 [Chytridium lagenaria]|nr:hypothetical protein BC829DRAFT_115318 [Chytridium lagenaria]
MSLPVTFREHSTYLMFISVCLLYIYLFFYFYFRPFINPHNNNISTLGWITTVIFLFAGVIIGFLSKNPDDHFTIDITVLVMFYITITAMVHASFYEWVLMSGHKWRRKSQFMDRLMGTRIWKRVFPPAAEGEEKTVKIEEKGKESKSFKSCGIGEN